MAEKIKIKPSELSDIELGYTPPRFGQMLASMVKTILEDDLSDDDFSELYELAIEPFVMQKMPAGGMIFHASKILQPDEEGYVEGERHTRAADSDECQDVTDYINNYMEEHNEKADAYNKVNGVD